MSALAAINAPSWRVSPLSSQWKPADGRVSPLSSQWKPAQPEVAAPAVAPDAAPGLIASPQAAPADPAAATPATDYVSPSIKWTADTPAPKAADGREFAVWGGDKNIQGQKFYVDPVVADGLYGQLKAQQEKLGQAGMKWTAGEKNTDVPDEFVRDMAMNLAASGVTDLKDVAKGKVKGRGQMVIKGGPDGATYLDEGYYIASTSGGGDGAETTYTRLTPEQEKMVRTDESGASYLEIEKDAIINKRTGQEILNQYGGRADASKGIFGGTYQGKGNTGYQVMFDDQGNPYFRTFGASSSDIGKIAPLLAVASFIPGVAPFARIANGLIAADQGNPLGAIASFAGAVPGIDKVAGLGLSKDALSMAGNVSKGVGLINAVKNDDPLAAIVAGGDLAGLSDIGGVKLDDIKDVNTIRKAVESKSPLAIANAGWRLAQ